tara:strand:+ start:1169 stop:1876 length:708 start_codon:yes stop_codon:yes gene_type:complete
MTTFKETHPIFHAAVSDFLKNESHAVRDARKLAVQSFLRCHKVDTVSELTDPQIEVLARALKIEYVEAPASERPQAAPEMEPGPAFSLTRAGELADRSGIDASKCIRYLEAVAENKPMRELARTLHDRYDMTLLEAAKTARLIQRVDLEISREEAVADGKYWSIRASMTHDEFYGATAFMVVRNEIETDADREAFDTQHPNAFAFASTEVFGTKKDAMVKASTLLNVDQVTIRFV